MQVAAKKLTLKNVTDYITDIICKRAGLGFNYGVILIPEGLIDFIPEVELPIYLPLTPFSLSSLCKIHDMQVDFETATTLTYWFTVVLVNIVTSLTGSTAYWRA